MNLPAPAERIDLLDILRGVALPGILLMNIEWFTRPLRDIGGGLPADAATADQVAGWLVLVLVEGKFWLLFSLLFGAGFTVMQQRAQADGRPFAAAYARRCVLLLLMGVAHAVLLWPGDILHTYAIAGLLMLLFFARAGEITRLAAGLLLFALPTLLMTASTLAFLMMPSLGDAGGDDVAYATGMQATAQVYAEGDWATVTAQRAADFAWLLSNDLFLVPIALGIFLIGTWLLDAGPLSRPASHRRWHRGAVWVALPAGLALSVGSALVSTGPVDGGYRAADMLAQWLAWIGAPLLSLGYVGVVALLSLRPRTGDFLREWIAPSGRMALTNYLMASAICSTLFYGYGFGLWGQVPRAAQPGIVLAVMVLQCVASRWWLQRFRYGPTEWLWRAGTWLHWPALRR